MATKFESGLSEKLHTILVELVESIKLDFSMTNLEEKSCQIADLIRDNYSTNNGRNRVRSSIVKVLNKELGCIENFPTLEYKKFNNIYPVSYLFSRDDLSPNPNPGKKNLKSDRRNSIDACKLIDMAKNKLYSDNWKDILIGLAFLTGRRQFELAFTCNFNEYDRNIMIVSGILKKRENEHISTYKIPTLIESSEIMIGFQRLRDMTFYKFQKYRDLTIEESEKLFNGNECRQISTHLETDDLAIYIKEITDENFEFRDLRTLYGSLLFNYQNEKSNSDYAIGYAQNALCHNDTNSTTHYLKYNFVNFPNFDTRMMNLDNLGEIKSHEEKPIIEVKYSELSKYMTPNDINDLSKLDVAMILKIGLDNHRKTDKPIEPIRPYRGSGENKENVMKIVDCIIRHNNSTPNKNDTLAFSVRSILEIHEKIFGAKIQESTITSCLLTMETHITSQIEKYSKFWASKKVGNRKFYTNKHLGKNLDNIKSEIVNIYHSLNDGNALQLSDL